VPLEAAAIDVEVTFVVLVVLVVFSVDVELVFALLVVVFTLDAVVFVLLVVVFFVVAELVLLELTVSPSASHENPIRLCSQYLCKNTPNYRYCPPTACPP